MGALIPRELERRARTRPEIIAVTAPTDLPQRTSRLPIARPAIVLGKASTSFIMRNPHRFVRAFNSLPFDAFTPQIRNLQYPIFHTPLSRKAGIV